MSETKTDLDVFVNIEVERIFNEHKIIKKNDKLPTLFSSLKDEDLTCENIHKDFDDIFKINERAGTFHQRFFYRFPLTINYYQGNKAILKKNEIFESDSYELMRKLSLSLLGEKLNRNVCYEDIEYIQDAFTQIYELYYKLYRERIQKLKDNDIELITDNI